ncbi:MAG: PASTA domain-containing protein, partial [Rhodococcus sp.]
NLPMSGKTGTTESNRSSGFLGFTNNYAAAVYTYGDSPTPSEICSFPLRPCGSGNLYGGNEPARTWFDAMSPIATNYGPVQLPPVDQKYVRGSANGQVPDVTGQSQSSATSTLQGAGFQVTAVTTADQAARGTVVSTSPSGSAVPGSNITIYVSDGSVRPAPAPAPALPPGIQIPDLPPGIQIPAIPGLTAPR